LLHLNKKSKEAVMAFYKRLTIALVLLLLSTSISYASECKISILHFNDLHGNLATPKKGLGGAERLASLIGKIEAENNENGRYTLLLNGGDLISGTPISGMFKGEAEFKFLNLIGTEAMVIGNHEFDFGREALDKNIARADFAILGANISSKEDRPIYAMSTYVIPLKPGCRVGILGLTIPIKVKGLKFEDPVKVATDFIEDLKEQAEVRIALTHMYLKEDIMIAEKVPGFTLVVGGHDHVPATKYCRTAGGIPVCETPSKGRYLGKIDLTVSNEKVIYEGQELIPVDKKAGKSKYIREELATYLKSSEEAMKEVIGSTKKHLYYRPKQGKVYQPSLAKFITAALRLDTNTEIAFMNMGGIRKDIKKGKVRRKNVYEALPFDNQVGTMTLTGKDILDLIKISEKRATTMRPQPYLCWSGLNYTKSNGNYSVTVGGEPLDMKRKYKITTVDFVAGGGDGYYTLKNKKFQSIGKYPRDIVAKYFK